jgi:hypothetical protein
MFFRRKGKKTGYQSGSQPRLKKDQLLNASSESAAEAILVNSTSRLFVKVAQKG